MASISKFADEPLALIATGLNNTSEKNAFKEMAAQMAVVHNVLIRGYNSIYKQANHVKPHDVCDFLGYCKAWTEQVLKHHHSEETVLFPMLSKAAGVPGLMDSDKNEHEAFYDGIDKFKDYVSECLADKDPADKFRGKHAVELMDTFGSALQKHLRNEPARLALLSRYPEIDLKPIIKATEDDALQNTSPVFLLPMLWYNHDVEYEGGVWRDFPPGLPVLVKWVMVNVLGWWRGNWWRFGSVDRNGKLVTLLALRDGSA